MPAPKPTAGQAVRKWVGVGALAAGSVAGAGMAGVFWILEKLYASVKIMPPCKRQLDEENFNNNPLYRALPTLAGKLAWRQLGNFPTPVHKFSVDLPGDSSKVEFWVKREDLSSEQYGGNKVRTLQYQLAAFESHVEQDGEARFLTLGSAGSNQVVATKTHAACLALPARSIEGLNPAPDKGEMDNTLNFLSALSLPGHQEEWGKGGGRILSALMGSGWVLMPGGNGPLGVLGQLGGILELAEQIAKGDAPDLDGIVVAQGSNCTITGIIMGVALSREVGYTAFRSPGFRIYGQPVHPGLASMQRYLGFLTSSSIPLTIGRGIKSVSALLVSLGGPDICAASMKVMQDELFISTDLSICGEYGAHSDVSRKAKEIYDTSATVESPIGAPHLWLCGHFSAKSFALVLRLLGEDQASNQKRRLLFWETKSGVQPLGPVDEWTAFEKQRSSNKLLAEWAVVGGEGGTGHPAAMPGGDCAAANSGKERLISGPEDYRSLMRPVQLPSRL